MNCKPGDLAWIVRAAITPELLGHIVEVVGPWDENKNKLSPNCAGFTWEVRYPSRKKILRTFGGGELRILDDYRAFADSCLRPIRPGDLHETDEERKEVTA